MSQAPQWFRNEIASGLQRLLALHLPGRPPAETITLTNQAWIDSLWPTRRWIPEDTQRLHRAYISLSSQIERWPAPRQLLAHLPPRKLPPQLDKPAMTEQQRHHALHNLKTLRQQLRQRQATRSLP